MIERGNQQREIPLSELFSAIENSKVVEIPAKEILYEQEEKARNIYIVEQGKVYTQRKERSINRVIVDTVANPGDILGTEALLEDNYYDSTAYAAVNSRVVGVEQDSLLNAALKDPTLTISLFETLTKDILNREEHLFKIREAKTEIKEGKKLKNIQDATYEFSDEEGKLIVPHTVVAGRVGLRREEFTRNLLKVNVHLRKGAVIPDFPKI